MPKVQLTATPDLAFELYLAKELHMTCARLRKDLGTGELVLWRAHFELEYEAHQRAKAKAEREAEHTRR